MYNAHIIELVSETKLAFKVLWICDTKSILKLWKGIMWNVSECSFQHINNSFFPVLKYFIYLNYPVVMLPI